MSKRLSKLPSPAMAVAFVALLAALTGTAVALPGTNTVTKNDLVNGAVGKAENGANSTGRSEIRTGAVTGSEAAESTFGTVPTAGIANAANQARVAGAANLAGAAFQTVGLNKPAVAGVNDGGAVQLYSAAGFSVSVQCDTGGTPGSGEDAEIAIENVSAGDNSHLDSQDNGQTSDFDEGDVLAITAANDEDTDFGSFTVFGSAGGGITGTAGISVDIGGDFGTDCRGHILSAQG